MKQFQALLRLQLLSRFADWKPRNVQAQLRQKKAKTIFRTIGVAVLILYLLGIVIFVENALMDVLIQMQMPEMMLSIGVTMAMLSTLILAFFYILSTLYFDRDAVFTASLPIKSRTILSAKLTQVWLSETGIAALLILPACILYGVKTHPGAMFYVRMALVWLGVAVLPIVIVAFLSALLIRVSGLWKKREMVATVGGIALLIAYMFLCMNMGSITGSDDPQQILMQFMMNHQARVEAITRLFPPATWAAKGLMGDWGQLLIFLAVCAAAAVFTVWVLGFDYRRLSMLQSETPAGSGKKLRRDRISYAGASAFKACFAREWKQIFRVPAYATNILPIAIMPVLMVGVMAFSFKTNMSDGESVQMILDGVGGGTVTAVMAAMMAFMAGMNPAFSSAVTREGKGHAYLTALPVASRTIVLAKLAVGMILSLAGCLPAAAILAVLVPGHEAHAVLAFLMAALFCFVSGSLALANDTAHPKLDWVTETEAIKQKSGSLVGLLISWALLGLLGILTYLMLSHGFSTAVYAAVMIVLLLAFSVAAYLILLRAADRKYWQD